MDYTLKNVYDTQLFQNQIYRINNIVEHSPKYSQEHSQEYSQKHCQEQGNISHHSSHSNDEKFLLDENTNPRNLGFLRIKIPIAGVDGDFRMQPGTAKIKGRASETIVEVLQYGFYQVSFIYLTIYLFIYLLIHFIYLFILLFIYFFIFLIYLLLISLFIDFFQFIYLHIFLFFYL